MVNISIFVASLENMNFTYRSDFIVFVNCTLFLKMYVLFRVKKTDTILIFDWTGQKALKLKKNGIFIMTWNRISLFTFPHSSAVCKNDTMKLFNQPPVVLSYWPRHCCGIRPRLWAVSIVSNKKNLKNSISSKLDQTVLTPRILLFGIFATFWCLSARFGDFRSSLSQTSLG